MKKHWREQQALVTGGASGMVLAIAKKLHGLGVKVALCDLDAKKLQTARKAVGNNAKTLSVDRIQRCAGEQPQSHRRQTAETAEAAPAAPAGWRQR